ncbi:MAG: isopeptide-forming domain-containing fimbrial protein [Solobacterium sp.]|nr:isopeptide-forming domain-containing fimbrial protein [Solobacterium sp.]
MKHLKHLAAAVLTATTLLASGMAVSADASHSITIHNTNESISINGKTYSAYKLFDSTHSGDAYAYTMSTGNQFWSEELTAEAMPADGSAKVLRTYFDFIEIPGDETLINVIPKGTYDADAARSFADKMQPYLTNAQADAVSPAAENETAVITLRDDEAGQGYYLVTGTANPADPEGQETVISAVIVTNEDPDPQIQPKAGIPTLKKEILSVSGGSVMDEAHTAATAQIGSVVSFRLTSLVPDLTGYDHYTFTFNDALSSGLDYIAGSFELKINEVTVGISPAFAEGNRSFSLTIPFETLGMYTAGDPIALTYSAKVNSDALTADYAKNTASLTYSNNPYETTTNTTPDKENHILNIDLDVNKVAGSVEGQKLANAEFRLHRLAANGTDKQYYAWDETAQAVTWVTEKADADTFTTGTDGKLTSKVRGLSTGTYWFEETKAPAGYNLLDEAVEVTVSASLDGQTVTFTAENAAVAGGTVDLSQAQNTTRTVVTPTVINMAGSVLPRTGGSGTAMFYLAGIILILAAGAKLASRRKVSEQ